jgi:hypothetical protein
LRPLTSFKKNHIPRQPFKHTVRDKESMSVKTIK